MRLLYLIQPQSRFGFMEMKTCKMRKKSRRLKQDNCSLISAIVIVFCILSPICNGEQLKEKLQPADISEDVKPSEIGQSIFLESLGPF